MCLSNRFVLQSDSSGIKGVFVCVCDRIMSDFLERHVILMLKSISYT